MYLMIMIFGTHVSNDDIPSIISMRCYIIEIFGTHV